jgi:Sec-independent protein translocase protein TatA
MIAELLQPSHFLIIVSILLLFFGGRAFASLGRGFSTSVKTFRRSLHKE